MLAFARQMLAFARQMLAFARQMIRIRSMSVARKINRRRFLGVIAAAGAAAPFAATALGGPPSLSQSGLATQSDRHPSDSRSPTSREMATTDPALDVVTKTIPSSGIRLPVIGMGTWITFNVGDDPEARSARTDVMRTFFANGGGMIDSSPMYGSSEEVVGHGLRQLGLTPGLFSATKVWTSSAAEGPRQVARSHDLWGVRQFDLQQVHNLISWEAHLEMLFAMKNEGRLGHVGVTTSHGRRHGELEDIMRTQPIDFVQLTYNLVDREVEDRLLPLAIERGIAVIANRPFRGGPLVDRIQRERLPGWANEFDCRNWPQFLLKFIVSHPAVTCAIPATTRVDHMRENMGAAQGRLPDAEMRTRMLQYVAEL
jgi:diketogulonate reductase-like aldo/keto reductase